MVSKETPKVEAGHYRLGQKASPWALSWTTCDRPRQSSQNSRESEEERMNFRLVVFAAMAFSLASFADMKSKPPVASPRPIDSARIQHQAEEAKAIFGV